MTGSCFSVGLLERIYQKYFMLANKQASSLFSLNLLSGFNQFCTSYEAKENHPILQQKSYADDSLAVSKVKKERGTIEVQGN